MAILVLSAFGLSKVAPARMGTMKVYVTNSLGTTITRIDLATRKADAEITVGKRVHGICAPPTARSFSPRSSRRKPSR